MEGTAHEISGRSIFKIAAMLALGGAVFGAISPFLQPPGIPRPPLPLAALSALTALQGGVFYGILSGLGLLAARRLRWGGAPLVLAWVQGQGVREQSGSLFRIAIPIGLLVGVAVVAEHAVFASFSSAIGKGAHPAFPFALLASAAAGYGEELIFRLFVLSVLALVLRFLGKASIHVAVVFAAALFALGHAPAAAMLTGKTLAEFGSQQWAYLFVINGTAGAVYGYVYRHLGWESAAVCHFSTNVIWHFLYPVL